MTNPSSHQTVIDIFNSSSAKNLMINDILERAKATGKISPSDIAKILPREALKGNGLATIIQGIGAYLKREKVEIKNFVSEPAANEEVRSPESKGKRLKSTGRQLVSLTHKKERIVTRKDEPNYIDTLNDEEEGDLRDFNLYSSVNSLFQKVAQYRLLTAEEEVELSRRIRDEGDVDARNEFVVHNLRLVISVARRYTWSKLPLEDLIQEGTLGLMTAAEKYDHTKGWRFTTYAMWWIRQGITRAIQDTAETIRVPVHLQETMNKIRSHLRKTGRDDYPRSEILAKEMKLPIEKIKDAYDAFLLETSSIYEEAYRSRGGDNSTTVEDTIIDEVQSTPEFALQIREELELSVQFVNLVLETVKRVRKKGFRDYEIFKLIYGFHEDGEPWTLEMVGQKFGVSRERIRQILNDIHEELFEEGIRLSKDNFRMYCWRIQELQKMANMLVQF